MKTPDPAALAGLRKAAVTDPVIAGKAGNAGNTSNTGVASHASHTSTAGKADTKFTIRLSGELMGRVRAAYLRDLTNGFSGSLSAWAAASLESAVIQSEDAYNGGKHYQPIETGSIPTGIMPNTN